MVDPNLGREEDVLSFDSALFIRFPDLFLVEVRLGRVEAPVSALSSV